MEGARGEEENSCRLSALSPQFVTAIQDLNAAGALGDATLASTAKGEAALTHGAQAFVELLREVDRFDFARLREGPLGEPSEL